MGRPAAKSLAASSWLRTGSSSPLRSERISPCPALISSARSGTSEPWRRSRGFDQRGEFATVGAVSPQPRLEPVELRGEQGLDELRRDRLLAPPPPLLE